MSARTRGPQFRSPASVVCSCGKKGWPSQYDADQIVVNAKIQRHLYSQRNRQEQRSYRCPTSSLWHVTSQERAYI